MILDFSQSIILEPVPSSKSNMTVIKRNETCVLTIFTRILSSKLCSLAFIDSNIFKAPTRKEVFYRIS